MNQDPPLDAHPEPGLEARLAELLRPMKGLRFELVVRALYGATVERFDPGQGDNRALLEKIDRAMRAACEAVQAAPIERPRPNEVGNDMESFVIEALHGQGLAAAAPTTKSGRGKTSGYPDVRIETGALPVYLEVKTYAAANHATTQRSFYLSPAEDHKVAEDGYHLLVGFEIERSGNRFIPVAFEIVDLHGLECDLKAEFNSDNRRLYEPPRTLIPRTRVDPSAPQA